MLSYLRHLMAWRMALIVSGCNLDHDVRSGSYLWIMETARTGRSDTYRHDLRALTHRNGANVGIKGPFGPRDQGDAQKARYLGIYDLDRRTQLSEHSSC
jgi:hypothetical protein